MTIKIIKLLWKIIQILWVTAEILLLMAIFYGLIYDPYSNKGLAIILGFFLLFLSYPGSHFLKEIGTYLLEFFDINYNPSSLWSLYISFFLIWNIFFVIGYLQWFKLLPYLVGKLWGWKGWRRISARYRAGHFRLIGSSSRQASEPASEPDWNDHDP